MSVKSGQPHTAPFEEVYLGKQKLFAVQLGPSGLYNGPSTLWNTKGVKQEEGSWTDGFREGEWNYFDASGNLESRIIFQHGHPMSYLTNENGVLQEVSQDQWPFSVKYKVQSEPAGVRMQNAAK